MNDKKVWSFHTVYERSKKIPTLNYFALPNVRIWEISDLQNYLNFRLSFRFVKFRNWFHEFFPVLRFRCLEAGMDPSKVLPPEEAKKIYKKQFKSQKFIDSDDDSENKWIFFSLFLLVKNKKSLLYRSIRSPFLFSRNFCSIKLWQKWKKNSECNSYVDFTELLSKNGVNTYRHRVYPY